MDKPRVFEDGTVTLVLGQGRGDCALYAGSKEVALFDAVVATSESEKDQKVVVRFGRSHDPEVSVRIEEAIRTLRTIPWIGVIR